MIFIWIKRGGFCNQLFQLKRISEIKSKYIIIVFNFKYREIINNKIKIYCINFNNKNIKYISYKFYEFILKKIINVVNESNNSYGYLNFIDDYWQNPVDEFSNILCQKNYVSIFEEYNSVAIHVRLGDYVTWTVDGIDDITMPSKYYLDAVENISKNVVNPYFILFSDDPVLASKLLSSVKLNYVVRTGNEVEDLILLGSCKNFILSPSTFSYVGAFMQKSSSKIIIAPRYWIGHKHKYWIPNDFIDSRITYIDY